jgi:predicted AlkP superfamily phosphohydrolase/phosphomutase/Flp pilus assembly protein TadD
LILLVLATLAAPLACRRTTETAVPSPQRAVERRAPTVDAADVPRTPRPSGGRAPVIWLGLDGLDWELLDRLASEGKMPNWKRLVEEGSSGRLSSFLPILSPVLWTTAATGVGPDVHHVLDFQEVDPKTGQKVPISGRSRAVPAVWNLASAAGIRVGVVGWWATHPAEEVEGFFVSDRASPILFGKLPLAGSAYPAGLQAGVTSVVSRDGETREEDIRTSLDVSEGEISAALASEEGMENPIVALARIYSATRVYQRIARDLYDRSHPDLMAVYFEGTDEVGHVFASYVPPKLSCVSDDDFRRYSRAVDIYYQAIDRIVGQWMTRAAEDGATLLVHSDHGFRWGSDRPCERSSLNWATAGSWHRIDGVYALWGRGVRKSSTRGSAKLFDVAPTVLALLGLPADVRMTGRPIVSALDRPISQVRKDLFTGVSVRRVAAEEMSSEQASEYAKKLLALGYLSRSETRPLEATGGDAPGWTEGAWNNLGLYEREVVQDRAAARKAFEKSLALSPGYHSPMYNLAILARDAGQFPEAEKWLFRSIESGHPDPEGTVDRWAALYRSEKRDVAERRLLEEAVRRYPSNERLATGLALARFRARDCPGADAALTAVEPGAKDPETLNALGLVKTCLGRREDAIAFFERSLAIKPAQPGVVESLKLLRGDKAPPGL